MDHFVFHRSTADIEGWLAGQRNVSPEDEEWEPQRTAPSEPRLPKTIPKAIAAAPIPKPTEKKPPQVSYRNGPSKRQGSIKHLFQLRAGGKTLSKFISAESQLRAGCDE